MIWHGDGKVELEREHSEPRLRTCWECNSAHKHLKKSSYFHTCFACGRSWCLDWDFDQDASDDEFDAHFSSRGLKLGDSTTKITLAADDIVVLGVHGR